LTIHYEGPGLDYTQEFITKLEENWIWSYCFKGYGFESPGNWNTGTYSVSINCLDENLVKKEFVIVDK
jgi:hypothetical protein